MTTSSQDLRKTLQESATAFFHNYEDASRHNDANIVSRGLAANCTRKLQPNSFLQAMGYPMDSEILNSEYQSRIEKGMRVLTVSKTEIFHMIIDAEKRKVAAQTIVSGKWNDGEETQLDFAWFLYFSQDGKEIVRIIEYMDSPPTKAYYAKMQTLLAAQA